MHGDSLLFLSNLNRHQNSDKLRSPPAQSAPAARPIGAAIGLDQLLLHTLARALTGRARRLLLLTALPILTLAFVATTLLMPLMIATLVIATLMITALVITALMVSALMMATIMMRAVM
ncbi:conserved protein of unknown function [Pseudomonas marincola]|uniref:Uncharacterized protein n=1 Tax=Pseudomonas marincola TaxID=437900 RepID=A0A653E0N0_9PSED|nr:conserved protein of unknown function [Pseudomonas marincola]